MYQGVRLHSLCRDAKCNVIGAYTNYKFMSLHYLSLQAIKNTTMGREYFKNKADKSRSSTTSRNIKNWDFQKLTFVLGYLTNNKDQAYWLVVL